MSGIGTANSFDALLADAIHTVGLPGRVGPAAASAPASDAQHWHVARASRNQAPRAMADWWASRHPEAGRAYVALRCWGLLIWPAVYLSAAGLHRALGSPSLESFGLDIAEGMPTAFALSRHALHTGPVEARLAFAADQLVRYCECARRALDGIVRLNPVAARGTLADCVLAAVLSVCARQPFQTLPRIRETGMHWLSVLQLQGASDYIHYVGGDGIERLALDRRVCCYHFRRHDGDFCSTCPRLAPEQRLSRLRAEQAPYVNCPDCLATDTAISPNK